jgi:hypothetical protein
MLGAVLVVGAVVPAGAERVPPPPPPPPPPPVCASASPKAAATNPADKADMMINLLMSDLLQPVLRNSR